MARGVLVIMLAGLGDACRAVGNLRAPSLPGGRAVQVIAGLGWPDLLGGGAGLEQADLSSLQR